MTFRYAALILCGIMIIIFIAQNAFPITETLVLEKDALARPWIFITSVFLHGSASHLLGNLFALGLFGSILERIIGCRKFLAVFFAAGVISGFASMLFYDASLGASGAIFGVLGALTALRPRMMVWTYGVPMPMFMAAGFWLVLDVAGAFFPSNVANIAHIAGLAFGIIIGIQLRKEHEEKKENKKIVTDSELDEWEEEWM